MNFINMQICLLTTVNEGQMLNELELISGAACNNDRVNNHRSQYNPESVVNDKCLVHDVSLAKGCPCSPLFWRYCGIKHLLNQISLEG